MKSLLIICVLAFALGFGTIAFLNHFRGFSYYCCPTAYGSSCWDGGGPYLLKPSIDHEAALEICTEPAYKVYFDFQQP